VTDTSIYGRFK